ncbi:MAG TPA: TetR/AcrR family transcriptional regulator [Verrucomicrobiae bacterium]|nr:TetR/AcrR family transcriptional regulator [Verrucomicrobiae bacterium]
MKRRAQKIKTEIRQEQIARAALVLIARRGLNHLNIGALSREVGVVPSAIYRHYPGKDRVLESVLDLISRSLLTNIEAVCQATPDALERLHLLLMRHVQLVRHHAGIPRVLFSEQIFAGSARRKQRVHQTLQGYLQKIARIIAEGRDQGQIRADIAPDTAAVMFLGLVQPAIILWLMSNGTFDVAGHAERAWCLFREMLETPGGRSRPDARTAKKAKR